MDNSFFRNRTILGFIITYYAIYTIVIAIVEPFGWFGENNLLQQIGPVGHLAIILLPAIALLIYYFAYIQKQQIIHSYLGLESISTGVGRTDAFREMTRQAKHRLIIVGIGMSYLANNARDSLQELASSVPIDFLMLDPEILDRNKEFAATLESFRDRPGFTQSIRQSFHSMQTLCEEWNSKDPTHIMRLRVYNTLPTMSMVLIDPEQDHGEMLVEFFPYRFGEYRPRLHIRKIESKESLFHRMQDNYTKLWESAKKVVG